MDLFEYMLPWEMLSLLVSGLWSLLSLVLYAYVAFCLYTIAKKTNTENPWLAWIPIANIILACQIADKPWWWVFFFFIPIANIVFAILVLWKIAEVRNKPGWLGILMIVPIANLVILGILAFAE
ncbi:hypothetical protein KAJ02_09680 [Candidatus Bipolaricaulota bacterium]|nr:hypothetical protein [Candidatus Bipolaricaulota bacterium]